MIDPSIFKADLINAVKTDPIGLAQTVRAINPANLVNKGTDILANAINPTPVLSSPSLFLAAMNKAGGIARQNKYKVMIDAKDLSIKSAAIAGKNAKVGSINDVLDEFGLGGGTQSSATATDWMNDYAELKVNDETLALTAFCQQTQLPGYQFQMETQRIYGPSYQIPHMPEYQPVTMTFLCGAAMNEKYFFDAWMYMVMDPISNNFNYIREYSTNIAIVMYDETGISGISGRFAGLAAGALNAFSGANKILQTANTAVKRIFKPTNTDNYHVMLVDAYPISVAPLELGYDMENSPQKIQVTFTYKLAVPFDDGRGSTVNIEPRGNPETFDETVDLTSNQLNV